MMAMNSHRMVADAPIKPVFEKKVSPTPIIPPIAKKMPVTIGLLPIPIPIRVKSIKTLKNIKLEP